PDLDAIYQSSLALLGQQGGWPLTMFLTPAGDPFWGGTYFPPSEKYGRPGFPDVLRRLAEIYRDQQDKVAKNAAALRDALANLAKPQTGGAIPLEMTDSLAERLLSEIDPDHGGIGGAPKFPHVPAFELIWRGWKRLGDRRMHDAVIHTLTCMSQGGIYDHLGGGFARYAVDAKWLVPHFEKMLYDNAQLIALLTLVWQETREGLFRDRVHETVGWVLREMRAAPGNNGHRGFTSSLDADSEHEEGKFYVWSEADIDAALGTDADFFKTIYDVTEAGNWEAHNILNRTSHPAPAHPDEEASLLACRAKLFALRAARVRPGWDDKVLADWNGLMIAALAAAAQAFDQPEWLAAAADALDFVAVTMTVDGRLTHSWRQGVARNPATLEDYACLAWAALALHEATGDDRFLAQAGSWVATLDRHYWDPAGGGYFTTADDTRDVIVRTKNANDNAVPSGNGVMVGVLARLFHLTGLQDFQARADALIAAFSGELNRNFLTLATMLNNNELLQRAQQIVIIGARGAADTRALLAAVHGRSLPNRILTVLAPGDELPAGHPAAGKSPIKGAATAYVCRGTTCSLPIVAPSGLSQALALG
ncbi:MAG: thioredoxin domain-containing protein, partial [Dongiaceae bacterium]